MSQNLQTDNRKGRSLDPEALAKLLHQLTSADADTIAHAIGCSPHTVRSAATGGRLYGATRAGILHWLGSI